LWKCDDRRASCRQGRRTTRGDFQRRTRRVRIVSGGRRMKIKETRDVTEELELLDRWTILFRKKPFLAMAVDFRYDFEFRITQDGIKVFQREQDEGKVGGHIFRPPRADGPSRRPEAPGGARWIRYRDRDAGSLEERV